jgi:hypothetical protein
MLKVLRMNHRLTCDLQISRTSIGVGSIALQVRLPCTSVSAGARADQASTTGRLLEIFLCASTLLRLLHSTCPGTRETGILGRQQVI